jgi:hypothetical protein
MTTLSVEEAERRLQAALVANDLPLAEVLARALLAGGSQSPDVWSMFAAVLRRQGRAREALPIQERVVAATPHNFERHFDLAEILLLLGDYDRGWREYRHRYSMRHTKHLNRVIQRPRWDGQPLLGKTLLIHDEQGYGDTFQFLRLVPRVKEISGARVVLQISREQESFARRMTGVDAIVLRGALPPPFDQHCEMMSLPMAMKLTLDDLPGPIPYLSADQARIRRWHERLSGLPRPLVALVWAGRPEHFNDANRSTSLARLGILGGQGISFLSVQKGPKANEAQTPPSGLPLIDLAPEIADFDDTAAILSLVDLLISVDSSPVHLAGALGRPAWVMLPFVPDWRWLEDRSDSPWYPSLRLFRQPAINDWDGMLRQMAAELIRFLRTTPQVRRATSPG